jgi:fructose-1,6-bisphosphatase I
MFDVPNLSQYLLSHLSQHPEQKELTMMLNDLASIGKRISLETNRAGLVGILGATGNTNVQDEEVQKLDIFANDLCKEVLKNSEHVALMASEEDESVVDMAEHGSEAKYIIAFDPLDGSSNTDVNVSIGTIFSVFKRRTDVDRLSEEQFFQPGSAQVLAGYILYGSSTVMVFSFGDGVHEFTLDPDTKDFYLSNERITIPETCTYYSVNEKNVQFMSDRDVQFVSNIKKKAGGRYIGSLVADIHRNLIKGGVFMYPLVDKKGDGNYKGKLRLNFELKPMAFLVEQAGGLATNGEEDILSVRGESLHQREAFVAGNKETINNYLEQ